MLYENDEKSLKDIGSCTPFLHGGDEEDSVRIEEDINSGCREHSTVSYSPARKICIKISKLSL